MDTNVSKGESRPIRQKGPKQATLRRRRRRKTGLQELPKR